ncbi:hypothetical protein HYFRA_00011488 [Hymenoscyphus fraxineus]|uniref:Uncharacterized protein n=1 Tax=Hymenoscyphus fraxineus TaxID=746836 RepID=A0A9N9L0I5_9HELO|nr:hypothetical protein HYFRA_00011488 [Hymenoscyphus fraxineus]
MRLLSAKNAVLLTAFISNLPHFVLGAPIAQTADVTEQVITRNGDLFVIPVQQAEVSNITNRDEDNFSLRLIKGVKRIVTRVIPRPPTPPVLKPRPHPVPVPVPVPGPVAPKPKPDPLPKPLPRPNPPAPKPNHRPIPLSENPGQGVGIGNQPKPMENYANLGRTQVNKYETAAKSDKPDTPMVNNEADLAKYGPNEAFMDIRVLKGQYKVDDTDVFINELKELKNFRTDELGFNINAAGLLRQTVVISVKDSKMINRGTYDKNGQFIVYQDAFKDADTAAGTKVPLNEIGMQQFQKATLVGTQDMGKTKNFKAAFLMDVQNKEFWAITRENYNDMKQPFSEILTFNRGTPQFDRIMGSPNFNSKFYSFANHHNAIGNKVPDKVIVVPKQAENSGNKLTVAVVFKDA